MDAEQLVLPISNYLNTPIRVSSPEQNASNIGIDVIAM